MNQREKLKRIIAVMESNEIETGNPGQFIRIHFGDEEDFTFSDGCFHDLGTIGDSDEVGSYLDAHESLIKEEMGWWMFEPDPDTRGRYSPELAVEIIEEVAEILGYALEEIMYVEGLDFKHTSGPLSWEDVGSESVPAEKYNRTGVEDSDQNIRSVFEYVAQKTTDAEEVPNPLPSSTFYDRDGEVAYALSPYVHTVSGLNEEQRETVKSYVSQDEYLAYDNEASDQVMIRHTGPQFEDAGRWLEVFQFLREEVLDINEGEITYGVIRYSGSDKKLSWDKIEE